MSKKKCPKCNSNMMGDCCVKCGYMSNGNVSGGFTLPDKYEDLKLYNKNFEKMNMNQNKFFVFLLESSYIAFNKHFIAAILIGLIDTILTCGVIVLLDFIFIEVLAKLNNWMSVVFIFMVIMHFFIKKIIYSMFANTICLKLDQRKINKIKKSDDNYKVVFRNNKYYSFLSLLAHFIINTAVFILSIIITFEIINMIFI